MVQTDKSQPLVKYSGADVSFEVLIEELLLMSSDSIKPDIKKLDDLMRPAVIGYIENYNGFNSVINFSEKQREMVAEITSKCDNWANTNIVNDLDRRCYKFMIEMIRKYLDYSYHKRDLMMAEIVWFVFENFKEKIIFLGHNVHISKGSKYIKYSGEYLKEMFGDKYYAVAFTFFGGKYYAREVSSKEFNKVTSTNAFRGTYEYMLNSISKSNYFLPLRGVLKIDGENDWLFNKMLFRQVGAVKMANEFLFNLDIVNQFDAVVFLNSSGI